MPPTTAAIYARRASASPQAAERVRAARLGAGYSQVQLAVRAGVSLQTLSLVERAGLLSQATAAKIAGVLGCTPEDLFGRPEGRR